ncbi:MAG: DUF4012 domain-containing protein [Acidimicrobiales bacterium]
MTTTDHSVPDSGRRTREQIQAERHQSNVIITCLTVASAVGGALAGVHPTGQSVLDVLYCAAFAALVTLIGSQASRQSLLVLAAGCVALSRSWLLIPAVAALGIAFKQVYQERSRRRIGALIGALAGQVMLRWPPLAFHGATALFAVALLVYPSLSTYGRLSKVGKQRTRRTLAIVLAVAAVLVLPLIVAAVTTESSLSRGQQVAEQALNNLRRGNSAVAAREFDTASADFSSASWAYGGFWTEPSRLVPLVAQHRQALAGLTGMATQLSTVAGSESPSFDFHALRVEGGQVNLAEVASLLPPARVLDVAIARAQAAMAHLDSAWLAAPVQSKLQKLSGEIDQAGNAVGDAVKVLPVLPAMLGAQSTQHYLVVFDNPSELRGLDGVITGYGEVTASGGKITLASYGTVDDLNHGLPPGGGTLAGHADFLARYRNLDPQLYFQNETAPPDMPTVGQVLAQLYPETGGARLNGVIAIDPYGLAHLLKLTGPVTVPGFAAPLTSENAASQLLEDQYILYGSQEQSQVRNDEGEEALHLVFDKLTSETLPGPAALSHALAPALSQGRIAMWSTNGDEESALAAIHATESFPARDGGDLLATTIQNSGENKIDVFLHESMTDDVTFNPATGDVAAKVTITLKNDAPTSGLPPLMIDNLVAPTAPPGSNSLWLAVYSPLRYQKSGVNGFPIPVARGRELGVNSYSEYFIVPSGSTETATFSLSGRVAASSVYAMHLRLQPMVNPVTATVNVTATNDPSRHLTWSTTTGVSSVHKFHF